MIKIQSHRFSRFGHSHVFLTPPLVKKSYSSNSVHLFSNHLNTKINKTVAQSEEMGGYCGKRFFASSITDLKSVAFYRALIGELLGVLFLVFVGSNTLYGEITDAGKVTRISLGFGLAVATLVWILANVSGGHINPAVSAGMFVTRKISLVRFLLYVVFQCIGGVIGAALAQTLTSEFQTTFSNNELGQLNGSFGIGLTALSPGVSAGQGIGIELLITFVLVITVFATCDGSRSDLNGSGPLAIGLSVTMCHLAFVPVTGASMNSARSFGPAAILNNWTNQVVYWVGPILGGIIAGLLYEFVFAGNAGVAKLVSWLRDADYERLGSTKASEQLELKPSRVEESARHA